MSTEPQQTLTRRRLLRNGAAGSVLLAAGPLLATAPARAARRIRCSGPQEGRHPDLRPQRRPDQLDPANSIIAGDVYTLDKIFEPLYLTSPAGELSPGLRRATRRARTA